jgi:hypothetical protein
MNKLLILFLILIALFFIMSTKKSDLSPEVSNVGPGYIPAFQGHPQIGVKS